jgi:hypothetical protein
MLFAHNSLSTSAEQTISMSVSSAFKSHYPAIASLFGFRRQYHLPTIFTYFGLLFE